MTVIYPELEVKLNSKHYDTIETSELEEDKVILQQFDNEYDTVYLCLNGSQVVMPLKSLKAAVDMLASNAEDVKTEQILTKEEK